MTSAIIGRKTPGRRFDTLIFVAFNTFRASPIIRRLPQAVTFPITAVESIGLKDEANIVMAPS